jgi:[acyl-carrier-protein] S-malonyltransferase
MSLGLLFPGQGTQHAAMLPWLGQDCAPLAPLTWLEQQLGTDWRARLGDPAWATRNDVAQPLLTGVCLAAWQQLQPLLPTPTAVAGYSVGELAAFSAAGVFSPAVALELAQRRAQIMDQCVAGQATGLLSVSGAWPDLIERLCAQHQLAVAIRLGPERCILGGLSASLHATEPAALAAGASCTRLAVSIASHTGWLAAGVPRLASLLDALPFERPHTTLVCNLDGMARRRSTELRHALAAQIAQTVRWDVCMDTLAERGVRCVLEVGPGTTLSRMWQARHPMIAARSVDEFQQPQAVAQWVRAALAG